MYINIISTITYDKGNLFDVIVGEGAFHQVYRGMYINNNQHYTLLVFIIVYIHTSIYLMKGTFTY
jgi:hypothetical protein